MEMVYPKCAMLELLYSILDTLQGSREKSAISSKLLLTASVADVLLGILSAKNIMYLKVEDLHLRCNIAERQLLAPM